VSPNPSVRGVRRPRAGSWALWIFCAFAITASVLAGCNPASIASKNRPGEVGVGEDHQVVETTPEPAPVSAGEITVSLDKQAGSPPESSRVPSAESESVGTYKWYWGQADTPSESGATIDSPSQMPVPYPTEVRLQDGGRVELVFDSGEVVTGSFRVTEFPESGKTHIFIWTNLTADISWTPWAGDASQVTLTLPSTRAALHDGSYFDGHGAFYTRQEQ
jgi:hypothetical protein